MMDGLNNLTRKRGRKAGCVVMTRNRQKVLSAYLDAAAEGVPVRLSELARRCGLYDYRKARRTVQDLRRMGRIG